MRATILPVLSVLLATGSNSGAQSAPPSHEYVRETWTVADGLPISTITSIIQTRDGYLWLGTNDGVVRFDGATIRHPTVMSRRHQSHPTEAGVFLTVAC